MMSTLLPLVQKSLDNAGLRYEVFACDPELADTAAFCERYGFSEQESANTIIVIGKGEPARYAACVVLATTKLDVNKAVCKLLGVKKASFAPMEEALKLSGMEYGGVTIFGLSKEIPAYVDERVMEQKRVVMGGGNRSSKVVIAPNELKQLDTVQVVTDLAKPK
jgi:prolyl-tRNA editing enzyme YbaK/EbsC (Cys-tRNA(Pro) deacylase)